MHSVEPVSLYYIIFVYSILDDATTNHSVDDYISKVCVSSIQCISYICIDRIQCIFVSSLHESKLYLILVIEN